MPRSARLDAPGTLHHVIVRGIERRKILRNTGDREEFVRRLGETTAKTGTSVYAWALLDNHAHFLVRSGPGLLSGFMRKLLTGYAVYYNRRYRRSGHLFQNRYKSIVCDEDSYFTELVRYIHLNPLRAGLVEDLRTLDWYPYSGHSCLMGRRVREWQDRNHVLGWFGRKEREARKEYRSFVKAGIGQGRRPELVGGGLIRSAGGWSEVMAMRRRKEKVAADERVLGTGVFVENLLSEAEERVQRQFQAQRKLGSSHKVIERICADHGVTLVELGAGSRRAGVSSARRDVVKRLSEDYGMPLAEIARQVGITTSGVWRILDRGKI